MNIVLYTLEQRWEILQHNFTILAKNHLSHGARFDLDGYVNKQYCRIWGTENPHALKSRRTQNESLFGSDFGPEA